MRPLATARQRRGMMPFVAGIVALPAVLMAAAALAAIVIVLAGWPGMLTPDSQFQLTQVTSDIVTDWHPPIMVRLWQLIGGTIAAMFAVQVILHWSGIWAFAESLRRGGRIVSAWSMLAVGLTPIALKYLPVIQKDTLLASFFIAAAGIGTLIRSSRVAAPLAVVGMLCRANAVFALPPLLMTRMARLSTTALVAFSILGAVLLVPMSDVINHRLLGAQRTGVARSLQLFDLAGIAHGSGDRTILPPGEKGVVACYTPLFWDTLVRRDCGPPLDQLPDSLTAAWVGAIVHHPLAYARHRIAHFNRTIFFIVPPMQQCVEAPAMHHCDFTTHGRIVDAVTKNALLWPALWLTVGMALLTTPLTMAARGLVASGVLYGAAYLIVGVASDFRYFYWTELAVQVAIVLQVGEAGQIIGWRRVAGTGIAVIVIGYAARLLLN